MQEIIDSIRKQLNEEMSKDVINTKLIRTLTKSLDAFQSFNVNSVMDPRLSVNMQGTFGNDSMMPVPTPRDTITDLGHLFASYMNAQKGHTDISNSMKLYDFFNEVEGDDNISPDKKTHVIDIRNMLLDEIIVNVSEMFTKNDDVSEDNERGV